VSAISDVNLSAAVDGHANRKGKAGGTAGAVGRSLAAGGTSDSGDDTGGRNLADGVIERVGDDKIAGGVQRDATWVVELRGTSGGVL
jgi:hypothetical protein